MMAVWDFDAWGQPSIVLRPTQAPPIDIHRTNYLLVLESNIIGLCRADQKIGETAPILVRAEDHLDDSIEPVVSKDEIIKRIKASRGM